MHRAAAVLVAAFVMGLMVTTASAQVVAEGNGVIIKGTPGNYSISRDGGRTWAPYAVRPLPRPVPLRPVVPPPPPAKPLVACDFYQCGTRIIAVPAGAPGPANGRHVGSGTIAAGKVDPKTNVVLGR
jgi:hypothetical protein